jgi:hypothetical protein
MKEIIDVIYEKGKLELRSSVFRSLYTYEPNAVIWKQGNDIYIGDLIDYNFASYNNKEITKIYETTDRKTIEEIYEATAYTYVYDLEERVAMLLSVIGYGKLELRQVDKK